MKKVITYGTFDMFHSGHYNLLKNAKALGDYLIVGVTTEQYDKQRGKLNVVDPILKRIENVKNTGFVDEILVEDHLGQKLEDIQRYSIDIFTVGSDWIGEFDAFREYCEVVYLERTKEVSSTMLREKMHDIVRLGIIGSGNIASRFVVEARYVSGINSAGVYNPRIESAKRFADRFELGFYEDHLESFLDKVDAVYIASPHHTHVDYAMKALESGKHVFCEKPMAISRQEADKLFEIAAKKELVLSEAIKTASCPGFLQLISVAKSGIIGSIRDVEACFTKLVPDESREWSGEQGGAFMELSSYPLLGIFKLLGLNYEEVFFDYFVTDNNTDYYSKAYFKYKNALATVKVGIGVKSEGSMTISGTKGYITVQAPWWKTSEFIIHYEDPGSVQSYHSSFYGEGLRYELSNFVHAIHNKTVPAVSSGESAAIAEVIERFIEKRGKING